MGKLTIALVISSLFLVLAGCGGSACAEKRISARECVE